MKKAAWSLLGFFVVFLGAMLGSSPVGSVLAQEEVRYGMDYENAVPAGTEIENIYYSQKADSESIIETTVPKYHDTNGLMQLCAVVAGASAIGYFDLYHENLIPNFEPARVIAGKTIFKTTGEEIRTLIQDLYEAMGTTATGTTYEGFQAGMTSYVNEHGYTFQSTEFGTDHAAVRSWIDSDRPVAIFLLNEFHLIGSGEITENGTYDSYKIHNFTGNHVVLAFGYRTITYYNADGTVKENHRLYRVFTGINDMSYGYVDLERSLTFGGMLGLDVVE